MYEVMHLKGLFLNDSIVYHTFSLITENKLQAWTKESIRILLSDADRDVPFSFAWLQMTSWESNNRIIYFKTTEFWQWEKSQEKDKKEKSK